MVALCDSALLSAVLSLIAKPVPFFRISKSANKKQICKINPTASPVLHIVGNRGVGNLRLIGLVGLGPASRVFTFHLLDSLRTATTKIPICPI